MSDREQVSCYDQEPSEEIYMALPRNPREGTSAPKTKRRGVLFLLSSNKEQQATDVQNPKQSLHPVETPDTLGQPIIISACATRKFASLQLCSTTLEAGFVQPEIILCPISRRILVLHLQVAYLRPLDRPTEMMSYLYESPVRIMRQHSLYLFIGHLDSTPHQIQKISLIAI